MLNEVIMAEARSFMKSRVILTAAELDFFTFLDKKPATAKEIAKQHSLDVRATTRVLDCLIALGLLQKNSDLYQNTEMGAYFSAHHPETVLPVIIHWNYLWTSWSGLTDIVKKGTGKESSTSLRFSDTEMKAFVDAMHVIANNLSREIADVYDLKPYKRLLDIGGASGTYTIAFLKKNPRMKAIIFELEDVIPLAQERLKEEGLSKRTELIAGDFYQDELPKGCDLALLSAIIHQNGMEENLHLYQRVHRALESGGTILIRDHVMDKSRIYPPAGTLFAINMLVQTRDGDTYTFQEIKETLENAGFVDVKLIRTGEKMDCLVEARKPA
ncbi:MAG: methyltransferase [Proteobacteria bacterium]|nr:methyltransferase [Pseudomonadota bacterium]